MNTEAGKILPTPTPGTETPRRLGRSSRFIRAVIGITALGLLISLAGPSAYSKLKRARALSRIEGLEDPASVVPVETAAQRIRLALLTAPGDPTALRVAAKFCTRMRMREAVDHWAQYLRTGRATDEDRWEACRVAIADGRPDLGRAWLEELVVRMPEDPRILTPLFELAIRWGNGAGAEKVARRRVELAPTDVGVRMDLAKLLVYSPVPSAREEAVEILAAIACDDGTDIGPRQQALSLLRSAMPLGHPLADRILQASRAMADSSLEARLLNWDLETKVDPTKGAGLLKEAAKRARSENSPERQSIIAFWLAARGGAQEAVDLLPLASCTNHFGMASVRLDCLLSLGRNQEVIQTLSACEGVLPAGCRDSMLGSIGIRQGQTNLAEVHFRKGIQASIESRDLRTAEYVAQEGARFGMNVVAVEALEAMLPSSREPLLITRRMVAVLRGIPDLDRVLQSLRLASRVLPEEPSVTLERAWHELYLGLSTPWCVEALGQLVKSGSATRDLQMAYAFALFRAGDLPGAQQAMDAELARAGSDVWLPRHQIVRIQVMGATGQREGARTLARALRLDAMRREVRLLVEPWL